MKGNSTYGSIHVGSSNDDDDIISTTSYDESLIDYNNNNDDGSSVSASSSQFDEYGYIYSQKGSRHRQNNNTIKKKFNFRRSYTILSIISIIIFFLVILISQTNILSFLNFKHRSSSSELSHLYLFSSTTATDKSITATTSDKAITSTATDKDTTITTSIIKSTTTATTNTFSNPNFKATLARSGYNPLMYFNPPTGTSSSLSSSSIYKYKLLEGYVGVIEPYANMELFITSSTILNEKIQHNKHNNQHMKDENKKNDHTINEGIISTSSSLLKDDSNMNSYYYTYTVCSVERTDECYTGIKSMKPSTTNTTPIPPASKTTTSTSTTASASTESTATTASKTTTTTTTVSASTKTTTGEFSKTGNGKTTTTTPKKSITSATSTEEVHDDDDDDDVGITIPCKPLTDYTIIVKQIKTRNILPSSSSSSSSSSNIIKPTAVNANDDTSTITVLSGLLKCMYVRREIRSLTESDTVKTMDAMSTLWTVGDDEGAVKYGSQYRSAHYLVKFHYFNAAWQEGDHIHEGNGFLPQHLKMTNIFEESIQTVDPSISLPYWDSTIEMAQGLSVFESPIFTPEMFGSLPSPKDAYWGWSYTNDSIADGRIPDGRWANIQATMNTEYEDLDFGYGYLRAPWNMNPSSYISRFTSTNKEFPICSAHYDMLNYTLLTDFLRQAPYDAHASTHGVTGGLFGCDLMNDLRLAGYINDEESQINICKNFAFYIKEMYRDNLIVPLKNCTLNTPGADTSHSSSSSSSSSSSEIKSIGSSITRMNKNDIKISSSSSTTKTTTSATTTSSSSSSSSTTSSFDDNVDIAIQNCGFTCTESAEFSTMSFFLKQVLNSDYETVPRDMPLQGWDMWVDFICSGLGSKIFAGDHLESASPADPSFWPIHPALERLLQAKYMAGGFESDEWPTDAATDYICDKSTCYNSTTNSFDTYDYCCYGHYQHDQLLDATSGSKYSYFGLTNQEMMDGTNPTYSTYSMTYIYDSFDWSHCAQAYGEELNFHTLIQSLSNRMSVFNRNIHNSNEEDGMHSDSTASTTATTPAASTTASTTTTTIISSMTQQQQQQQQLIKEEFEKLKSITITTTPNTANTATINDYNSHQQKQQQESESAQGQPQLGYQHTHQSFNYGTMRQSILDNIKMNHANAKEEMKSSSGSGSSSTSSMNEEKDNDSGKNKNANIKRL